MSIESGMSLVLPVTFIKKNVPNPTVDNSTLLQRSLVTLVTKNTLSLDLLTKW